MPTSSPRIQPLVLMRHAHSQWNAENRFSGWADVDLSPDGCKEALAAGKLLKDKGFIFDHAFTSRQIRARHTLDIVLEVLGLTTIPIDQDWRLNERHYGALQGLDKGAIGAEYGEGMLHEIRRGYRKRPPALTPEDPRHPSHDPLYAGLDRDLLPGSESLEDTERRVVPYWHSHLKPALARGERVLVVSHGNTLRALVRYLEHLSESAVETLEIPTGRPLLYRFGENFEDAARSVL